MIRGELGKGVTAKEETQEVTASLAAATGTSKDAAVVVAFLV